MEKFDLCQDLFGISEPELRKLINTKNGPEKARKLTSFKPGETKLYFSDCLPSSSSSSDKERPFPHPLNVSVINIGNVWSLELANAVSSRGGQADSLFQVASNFHGLEQVHPFSSPEQTLLSDYFYDETQGPMAVLPTALDLVWRRYLLKSGPYSDAALRGGTWPLSMLLRSDPKIEITVGGWADIEETNHPPKSMSLCRSIGCVVVKNALITHDQQGRFLGSRNMRIHQVLTSTLDMQFMSNAPASIQWMNVFLVAAYINTLSAARDLNASKVFLTLIGGGVFRNPIPRIFAAIATAINSVSFPRPPQIYIVMKPLDEKEPRSVQAYQCAEIVSRFASNKITFSQCVEEILNMK
jgi:hypothetical protein